MKRKLFFKIRTASQNSSGILFFCCTLMMTSAYALEIPPEKGKEKAIVAFLSITGTITSENGEPLVGASVVEKGTTHGVIADFDGNYTLEVSGPNAVLVVSYIGFKTQEVPVNGRGVVNIVLLEDLAQLEEVVVVGYGTQRKKDLTGAVAVVDVQGLKQQPAASPIEGLQGKATGV